MTKIDIFSGFLGAGKTTLIKKLIAEAYAGEKLVLIENEFGEINIDGGFLKESGIEISEMSAGCICCSLVGDFNKALREVVEQFHPDRILIEPSGVGKLSDVIVAVERTVDECPELKLNSYVTVADASKVKVYMKNFGEFYNNQIESAGTIVLSRTQKLSQEGMFITGKSAMTIGPWMVRSIKDRDNYPHDFKTAFAPYPTIDGVRTYTQGGYGDHLCINPKSKHIDAAWEFMKWYATEGMLPLTSGGRVPSANTYDSVEVTEYFLKGAEDLLDAETAQNVLIVPASNHAVPSITTKLPEINKVLTEELENIYTGVKTVQQGMDDAQARAEALLAK